MKEFARDCTCFVIPGGAGKILAMYYKHGKIKVLKKVIFCGIVKHLFSAFCSEYLIMFVALLKLFFIVSCVLG